MRSIVIAVTLAIFASACSSETAEPAPGTTAALTTTTTPVTTSTTTTTTTTFPPTPTTLPEVPRPDPPAPSPDQAVPPGSRGAVIVARGGADLFEEVEGDAFVRAHEGLVFPVSARAGDFLEVLTPCNDTNWVRASEVAFTPATPEQTIGAGFNFADAVVVLDPGHGGPNYGATGPSGQREKDVNLDIARRTRDILATPHTINWVTGEVLDGSAIPPAGQVWVTRTEGPEGADIESGLNFRTALANSLNAHALVSIHNNAAPDGPYDGPGSEVYHQYLDDESKRLAGLLVEEMRRGFIPFGADWVGAFDAGAKFRVRANGDEVYGILRRSEVPAVIAEGVYISNPSEDALLGTPEFRQAYADAVYRALVRFVTTDDAGSGFTEPPPYTGTPSSGGPRSPCQVPAQP